MFHVTTHGLCHTQQYYLCYKALYLNNINIKVFLDFEYCWPMAMVHKNSLLDLIKVIHMT